MKKVLIPGTFDPITYGHMELIKTALNIFDEVYVGIFIEVYTEDCPNFKQFYKCSCA